MKTFLAWQSHLDWCHLGDVGSAEVSRWDVSVVGKARQDKEELIKSHWELYSGNGNGENLI